MTRPTLPALGLPFEASPLTWVRDIEAFDGPILSEFRDEEGTTYLEKVCTRDEGTWRSLRVTSSQRAIEEYIAGRLSMLDLITKPNQNVGVLVDTDRERKIVRAGLVDVRAIPLGYLPEPDAMHDETLGPTDEVAAASAPALMPAPTPVLDLDTLLTQEETPSFSDLLRCGYSRTYNPRYRISLDDVVRAEKYLQEREHALSAFLATPLGSLQALVDSDWEFLVKTHTDLDKTSTAKLERIDATATAFQAWKAPAVLEDIKTVMFRILSAQRMLNDAAFDLGTKPTVASFLTERQSSLERSRVQAQEQLNSYKDELRKQQERDAALEAALKEAT